MLLGRKAASRASVGRKPYIRVSFQECPRGGCVKSRFDPSLVAFFDIMPVV